MTRTIGVEQSYSVGELASHNTAVWKAAVGPGSCLAQVPVGTRECVHRPGSGRPPGLRGCRVRLAVSRVGR